MIRAFGIAVAALALASCGESAATPSEAKMQLKAGKWQYWVIGDEKAWFASGGEPEGIPMGAPICLTDEDAAAQKLDPDLWFSAPFVKSIDCGPKTKVNIVDGKLSDNFSCRSIRHPGQTHSIQVTGEVSGDRYWAEVEQSNMPGYPPRGLAGQRIGDCS